MRVRILQPLEPLEDPSPQICLSSVNVDLSLFSGDNNWEYHRVEPFWEKLVMLNVLELILFPLVFGVLGWLLEPVIGATGAWSLFLSGLLSGIASFFV